MIESIMYLYRATGDPWLIDAGLDILRSIQHSAWTPCGYATVRNVLTHTLEDRMESFFLAETTKYLYLLFDPDNFIHNKGNVADIVETPGGVCMLDAGGYIFNTEAHPIDPAALQCCSGLSEKEIKSRLALEMVDILNPSKIKEFKGDLVPERIKMLERKRLKDSQEKKERERQVREKIEALAKEAQEAAAERERKNEEKRRMIQEAREMKINSTSNGDDVVQPTAEEEDEGEDEEDEAEEDEVEDEDPEFTKQSSSPTVSSDSKESHSDVLLTKQSQGETLSTAGIVQPEKMVNVFETKVNPLVSAISNIVNQFLPVESQDFNLEKFAAKLASDKESKMVVERSWTRDYSVMTCPALRFTDRFLFYGEFFEEQEL